MSMLRWMYSCSSVRSEGSTWKRCTTHGAREPRISALTMRSAVPMMGSRQRPMTAATMNRMATMPAMPARI